jgi:hypothetical protein
MIIEVFFLGELGVGDLKHRCIAVLEAVCKFSEIEIIVYDRVCWRPVP